MVVDVGSSDAETIEALITNEHAQVVFEYLVKDVRRSLAYTVAIGQGGGGQADDAGQYEDGAGLEQARRRREGLRLASQTVVVSSVEAVGIGR